MPRSRLFVRDHIRERVSRLPQSPGVYVFLDSSGAVLYVGKAKCLRRRVASYFQPGAKLARSRGSRFEQMVRHLLADIDVIHCPTELDALLRESRLIYEVQPPHNIAAKSNRSYWYLQVTDEQFPIVEATQEPLHDGVRLIGPFASGRELNEAMPSLQKAFGFRTCGKELDGRPLGRPCIHHGIGQCTAPCSGSVSEREYGSQILRLSRFLADPKRGVALKERLRTQMKRAARAMRYELAASLRNQLTHLDRLRFKRPLHEYLPIQTITADADAAAVELGRFLGLGRTVRTIEVVSTAATADGPRGAVACIAGGKPFKSAYRRYRLEANGEPPLAQVIRRRYAAAGAGQELYPDLVVLDSDTVGDPFAHFGRRPSRVVSAAGLELPKSSRARTFADAAIDEARRLAADGF